MRSGYRQFSDCVVNPNGNRFVYATNVDVSYQNTQTSLTDLMLSLEILSDLNTEKVAVLYAHKIGGRPDETNISPESLGILLEKTTELNFDYYTISELN